MWDGRLHDRRWSWKFVFSLQEYWDAFLAASSTIVPNRAELLGDAVALFVAQNAESGFRLDRIHLFIKNTTAAGRRAFSHALSRHVGAVTSEERRKLWSGLLKQYWNDRRTNVPRVLESSELEGMVLWVPAFPEVAMEVAELLLTTDCPPVPHASGILFQWKEEDRFVREHPQAACAVVEFLARRQSLNSGDANYAIDILKVAFDSGGDRAFVLRAAEAVAAATSAPSAMSFSESLRTQN
jgi:hypothetical protein